MLKNLNTTQKVCAMVGALSFTYWLLIGQTYSYVDIWDIFAKFDYWFLEWYGVVSFAITVGSVVGFFLFKDKK